MTPTTASIAAQSQDAMPRSRSRQPVLLLCLASLVLAIAGGCKSPQKEEPVAERSGDPWAETTGPALVKLGPNDPKPDLAAAFAARDEKTTRSCGESIRWFQAASSQQYFPFLNQSTTDVVATHEQAAASVVAFREVLTTSQSDSEFQQRVEQMFDIWQSVGYDADRNVLFTGYFSPEFKGSRTRTDRFQFPLYKRPADLVTDPVSGEPKGRKLPDGSLQPWPTRAEIESSQMFAGTELVWVETEFDAYIIHVNGSAKIYLPDNRVMYVGYAGKTDREYSGLGKAMMDEGLVPKEKLSLAAIREYAKKDPAKVSELMRRNDSYVFFTEYSGDRWPAGSLGVKVHEKASLATDKKIFPRGGVVMVDTMTPSFVGEKVPFKRILLEQDTGGAIRAAGRADIYMGAGAAAEILAGGQFNDGKLYYFVLKPEYVSQYPLPVRAPTGRPSA